MADRAESRVQPAASAGAPRDALARARVLAPGLLLSLAVAVAAVIAERITGWPGMVLALVLGMALHAVARRPAYAPGLTFAVKKVLRVGVALLGLRIAMADILALGPATAVMVVVTMAATIVAGVLLARLLDRDDAYGALAGGATAVCGASAALAISSVLPKDTSREADTVFVVLAVNALSTVAMVAYPLLCTALGFSEQTTGILLGATIHDVAQVVGAGYAVSDAAGNTATVVKLFRVFLLLPVALSIGWYFARRSGEAARAAVPVPVFAIVFLALVCVNSLGLAPPLVKAGVGEVSRWCLLLAISALGLGTSIGAMTRLGWRHMAVVTGATLLLLVLVVAALLVIA